MNAVFVFNLHQKHFRIRAHLHLATAISLQNLIYCFGVVLLHTAFLTVTVTATNFTITGGLLCEQFESNVAGHCTRFQLLNFGVVLFLNKVNIKMSSAQS